VKVPSGSLAFTYCGTPFVYHRSRAKAGAVERILVTQKDGKTRELTGNELPEELAGALFDRTGEIAQIEVWACPGLA
jgi:hypothetical protein